MSEIKFDIETSIEIDRGVEQVYEWMTRLPDALKVFPLMKKATEVEKGKTYAFQIGPFGYKKFSADAHFEGTIKKTKNKEVRLESIPGKGNTDLTISFSLEAKGKGKTRVKITSSATSNQKVPRLIPGKLVNMAAQKTASLSLNQGLKNSKKAIEKEFPAA